MGYLPQFKNDLFISYRRTSNEGQDPWVDNFCASVRAQLRVRVGREARLGGGRPVCGAHRVVIAANAMLMIHNPYTFTGGDAEDFRRGTCT